MIKIGYIYKITNLINNKSYIGQTAQTIEKRWKEHQRNKNYPYFQHLLLYKALNKYGLENFTIENIIEIDDEYLNEEEIKWITYYKSYENGYNMTKGGTSRKILELCNKDIINDYLYLKSARKVAKKYNVDHNTIDDILNKNNIPRFTMGAQRSKKVIVENNKEKLYFDCIKYSAKWFVDNNICRAVNIETARKGIANAIKKKTIYYGYKIYYEQ